MGSEVSVMTYSRFDQMFRIRNLSVNPGKVVAIRSAKEGN
jgi:hypothetical protein